MVEHNKSSEIVHTSASPFKVNRLNQSIEKTSNTNTSSVVNNSVLGNFVNIIFYSNRSTYYQYINTISDNLHKMNRTICNIKYDLNMVSDKINSIEGFNDFKSGDQSRRNCEDTFQTEFNNLLPLETEENLKTFENKLSNNKFKAKMVIYFNFQLHKRIKVLNLNFFEG